MYIRSLVPIPDNFLTALVSYIQYIFCFRISMLYLMPQVNVVDILTRIKSSILWHYRQGD